MSWSHGYVSDVPYTASYHPQQAPSVLSLACLLNRVESPVEARADRLVYVEFGCGRGRTALCLAASNPGWTVIGIDLLPAHVAEARALAERAGIDNATFLEADLVTLDAATLPEIDVASAHGLWSWVADPVRDGLVRVLAARLKAGGLLHLSYNSLPASQNAGGLQRLLLEAGDRIGGRTDRRATGALELAQALRSSGAVHLGGEHASEMLDRAVRMPPSYVSHEYMNRCWRPCYHADVLDALAPARLDHVGSAMLLENFSELVLSAEQRAIVERIDAPRLRELARDLCLHRMLRSDVFVRGARPLSRDVQEARLRDLVLCLTRRPDQIVYDIRIGAGTASLTPSFFGPVVAALSSGPRPVSDLLSLPSLEQRSGSAVELVGLLVGSGQATTVARPELPADASRADSRLNRAVAALLRSEPAQSALASQRLGAGLVVDSGTMIAAMTDDDRPEMAPDRAVWRHAGVLD